MDSEKFLFTLVDAIQRRESEVGLSGLAPKEQLFFLVWSLEAEVNNGGFEQFFLNSAGSHAAITAEALRTIGATRMAALVDRAIGLFGPEGPSQNRTQRQQQLESLSEEQKESLSDFDTSFYSYPDNLGNLLANYMRSVK